MARRQPDGYTGQQTTTGNWCGCDRGQYNGRGGGKSSRIGGRRSIAIQSGITIESNQKREATFEEEEEQEDKVAKRGLGGEGCEEVVGRLLGGLFFYYCCVLTGLVAFGARTVLVHQGRG